MAGNNDFLPFATGGGANVESQGAYAADATTGTGFQSGTAPSQKCNKVWRQASMVASMIGSFISGQNFNANDDGVVANLLASFTSALASYMQSIGLAPATGTIKLSASLTADPTWVLLNDGTIGDASSGATTRANADTVNLYTLLWNNYNNTNCPVTGGRGGSAAADFAAHKPLRLPLALGRSFGVAGSGSGLTVRAMGDNLGAETQTLGTAHLPPHTHGIPLVSVGLGAGGQTSYDGGASSSGFGPTDNGPGTSTPFSLFQPTAYIGTAQIKL